MRLKKGFTLAEILIVLMVIGVIATMTLPSLMRGVTESQLKTGYKKAYNTISNLATMEKVAGSLPSNSSGAAMIALFSALDTNLSVSAYAAAPIGNGAALQPGAFLTGITATAGGGSSTSSVDVGAVASGSRTSAAIPALQTTGSFSTTADAPWIITEDGFAYTITQGGTGSPCDTKIHINTEVNLKDAYSAACAVVIVDVNGLGKGPNVMEPQLTSTTGLTTSTNMETLTGDQYPIILGLDGATAGNKAQTVTGRIIADLK